MTVARNFLPPVAGHILVVDDDASTRELLEDVLGEEGYAVDCATNGREALDWLQRAPRPELIVLDLAMPVMDGWELHARLKSTARLAKIPVVVISGSGDPGPPAHVEGFVPKPIDRAVLVELIHECFAQR